jgi:inhibitor of cysteine peptidase
MIMKKTMALTLILLILIIGASTSFTAPNNNANEIKVLLDGEKLTFTTVQPLLTKGRVIVPLQEIANAFGFTVTREQNSDQVLITKDSTTIAITLNKKLATKNNEPITLDVPPTILVGDKIMMPVRFIGEAFGAMVRWDGTDKTVYMESKTLPTIDSFAKLREIMATVGEDTFSYAKRMAQGAADLALETEENTVATTAPAADYSTTNVQVQGIDEADLVKTDGEFIYQVNNGKVIVIRAYPIDTMEISAVLDFTEDDFTPQELYVDDKHLVVIGAVRESMHLLEKRLHPGQGATPDIYPPRSLVNTVKAVIYDLSDRNNITKLREVELEGNYISSRKIGSALYLVANRYIDRYRIMAGEAEAAVPAYRDTAKNDAFVNIDYNTIRYFPELVHPNYLVVASVDLDNSARELKVTTLLGGGENIYTSLENLYVAVTGHENPRVREMPTASYAPLATKTMVYKFALDDGWVRYVGKGEVPGTVLNQFSMDEHQGHFRIATTKGYLWRDDEHTAKNNLYILDDKLQLAGKIEDIAPGERIYSVRFLGDRAYMVTFRDVDPLFVLDLKDPEAPKILGYMKIPGYSDYLHPYDENHLIGFGKDTIELAQKDWQGNEIGTMPFYQGMKIALFDVTDVTHPIEKFKEVIGDRGTDSELLRNHKALLFAKEKNLFAFPVTVMEIKNKTPNLSGMPAYGEFTFQGAYVYKLNLEDGFQLQGRITHLTADDYLKTGTRWYGNINNVERILYINNNLYTLSKGMIKVNDLQTMAAKNSLVIPH